MISLSIILPVYNGEKNIARCIQSIFAANCGHMELIIINDGSTDASQTTIEQIIRDNSGSDLKVRLIEQENHGVAYARNRGIEIAQGRYMVFVDQDDYIREDYCRRMLKEISSRKADVVAAGFVRADGNRRELYRQKLQETDWSPYIMTAPWAHIYRTEFIREHKITFLDTGIGEDAYFNQMAYAYAGRVEAIPYEGYFWVDNPKSFSNTKQVSISSQADPFLLLERLQKDLPPEKGSNGYQEYFIVRYIVWYILYTLPGSPWKDVVWMQNRLFTWLGKYYPDYHKNKNISFTRPPGDSAVSRWSVWLVVHARRMGLIRPLLRILSLVQRVASLR